MKPTEQNTKTPFAITGFFAMLCGFLQIRGTGTPKIGQAGGTFVLVLAILALTAPPALALSIHPYLSQITGLSEPEGVAVDPVNQDVYVTNVHNDGLGQGIDVFNSKGEYQFKIDSGAGSPFCGLGTCAGDPSTAHVPVAFSDPTGDVYVEVYLPAGGEGVYVYGALGEYLEEISVATALSELPAGSFSDGSAVDSAGNVYSFSNGPTGNGPAFVEESNSSHVFVNDTTGTPAGPFGSIKGVAVNAAGDLYVDDQGANVVDVFGPTVVVPVAVEAESVANVMKYSAEVRAEVNPGGYDTHVYVEYGTTTGYGSSSVPVDVGSGESSQSASFELTGLVGGTTYHYRVVASNSQGAPVDGPDETFTTVPAVLVEGESYSNVGSSGVTLSAQLNPTGSLSTYSFEYGTSEAYGSVTPAESIGAGSETVGARVTLGGLQPGALYHFRAVATNAKGETVHGADATFMTYPASIAGLPDGRVYELVTPEFPGDLLVQDPEPDYAVSAEYSGELSAHGGFRAAADGSALAYHGTASPEGGYGGGGTRGVQYLARRTAAGWTSSLIQPLTGQYASYEFFSSDLSVGILESSAALTAGAPSGGYNTMYARAVSDGAGGYESLFDAVPSHRMPYEFGAYGYATSAASGEKFPLFAGASSDMSHKLFEANDALDAEAEEDPPSAEQNDLYDSYGGRLYLVNILPDGKVAPGATFGGAEPGDNDVEPDFRNDISSDGSRIFWTDLRDHDLYMRVNDTQPQSPLNGEGRCTVPADACTVEIDASQGPGSSGGGQFWDATPDGSHVFFIDCNNLTADSTATPVNAECGSLKPSGVLHHWLPEGNDLYEYNAESGKLTDLTVDSNASDPDGANVQGVVGTSEDGSYIYFVATGVLASGATAGQYNLYALHVGEAIRFVATLEAYDDGFASYEGQPPGDWQPEVGEDTAQVTPDGRHLIYMADYAVHRIYMYDFGEGAPYCISCSPIGAPEGASRNTYTNAANFPVSYSATYALRVMSSDGDRVFFDSTDALVPQDTNGVDDVYEWERDGSGSCGLEKGCLYLLSSGTGETGSYFLDASESGDDVFMVTGSQLGSQPQGEALHVIDAHVGAPLAPSECTGSGCQGLPEAPPIFATPSSVTFEGVGNFAASSERVSTVTPKPKKKGKKKRHKRKAKVKGKAKKAGARKAKRAATRGKAGRS